MRKKLLFLCLFVSVSWILNAQEVEINGKIIVDDDNDIEGIHIINITANKFTITGVNGTFIIPAKRNDTILVSGIKYKFKEVIVNDLIVQGKQMTIYLEENIYQLDEVLIGKFLTGDIRTDILNTKIKDEINFYDVGIPGFTGKPLTQSERKLFEADHGKMFSVFQNSLIGINIHKILNRISGRTKKLKQIVRIEAIEDCMNKAESEFSDAIFGELIIEDNLKQDFFYYASDDPKFLEICKSNYSMEMYEFLVEKLINYKDNLDVVED
jgi:hypothetical protein